MSQPCGCCAGVHAATPASEENRPGLHSIAYRVGTQATFFETMVARLSSLFIEVPAANGRAGFDRLYPLRALTTRELSDPSIALLDCWAVVADVLTFYQERIANEGYLGTATERRSIVELARLIGYEPRPGVSASVFLALTVADGFTGVIPAGTRAQSLPGTGERPQFFETSADLPARDAWNDLGPRVTRPQIITLATNPRTGRPAPIDGGTDAATRDTLYFQGISTNLTAGDALLLVAGDGPGQQVLRFAESVDAQTSDARTEVILQEAAPAPGPGQTLVQQAIAALTALVADAASLFPGSDLAEQVAGILQNDVLAGATASTSAADLIAALRAILPAIEQKHDVAAKRKFTRLEPWIADVSTTVQSLAERLAAAGNLAGGPAGGVPVGLAGAPTALGNLLSVVDRLAVPPTTQLANGLRLARSVTQTFSPHADTVPRLLSAFSPAIAPTIYRAWGSIQRPSAGLGIGALRVKAALFAATFPGPPTITQTQPGDNGVQTTTTSYDDPPSINTAWSSLPHSLDIGVPTIALDATYDKILVGTWVAIDRPVLDQQARLVGQETTFHRVARVRTIAMATAGFSARVTQLTLHPPWLKDLTSLANRPQLRNALASPEFLRGVVVHAQADLLAPAEEPLDRDVAGDTIELDALYDGLESGRWIIVSGARTDIPNTTGVVASELAMVAGITQGPAKQSCLAISVDAVPFTGVYYVTAPNAAGDRLVVGVPAAAPDTLLAALPLPSVPNQQLCDPIELAPGLYANAYLPTADERAGEFPQFTGLLVDPATQTAFSDGVIPPDRMRPGDETPVYAWRITDIASGQDTLHSTLVLAKPLAYTYDASTVTVYGNVAKATHGQTVGEVLGDGDGSRPFQQFTLGQSPLTYLPAPTPAGAESTLSVRVNEVEWHETDALAALGPRDRSYVTEADDAAKTAVVFGNGAHGARLPTGSANVKATYRYGIGKAGNVAALQVSQLANQPLGLRGVINPLRASGGADRDSRDQARRNAPLAVTALDRLVSTADYADFARTYAGIGKASSARLSDGRRQVVHVTVAGVDDVPIDPSSDLYLALVAALHQNGDPYLPIEVAVRRLKLLVVSAGVKVLADHQWESVAPAVRAALLDAFGFDRRSLGQSAFLGEVVSAIQAVEGVGYANVTTFDAVAEGVTAAGLAGLATALSLRHLVEADLARVDQAATDPGRRILPAELAILTPDIPDTLILTPISS